MQQDLCSMAPGLPVGEREPLEHVRRKGYLLVRHMLFTLVIVFRRRQYQGVTPPEERTAEDFDAFADGTLTLPNYHIRWDWRRSLTS